MKTKSVGRPLSIDTPEEMWKLFEGYVKKVKDNPFVIVDYVGKEATPVNRYKEKPLIMEGFEVYVSEKVKNATELDQYFANRDGRYAQFVSICSKIRRAIREDQISGGMANVYNASLTARVTGLVDRVETTVVKEQPLFSDEPKDE